MVDMFEDFVGALKMVTYGLTIVASVLAVYGAVGWGLWWLFMQFWG